MRAARLREAAATTPHYQRRRPEQTPLYRLVREYYATFAAEVDHASGGTGLPQFVKDEFDAYLDCGILANGFLRLTCDTCTRDTLVAFSCPPKGTPFGAQAARHLPVVRHAQNGGDRSVSGGQHPATRAGAPVGAVVSDPAA